MTRARDVADTQDNVGGAVAPFVAGKNKVINGGFDVWQRGTSLTPGGGAYTADRWTVDSAATVVRDTGPSNIPFSYKMTNSAGNPAIRTRLEFSATGNQAPYINGSTWTVSYWAKRSTGTAPANLYAAFLQNLDSSPVQLTNAELGTVTTSWQRFTHTFTISVTANASADRIMLVPYTNSGSFSGDTWFAGVQLEQGSVATPFTTASGSIGGELALCQRYYWRFSATGGYSTFAIGSNAGTTGAYINIQNPVRMRSINSVEYSNIALQEGGDALKPVTGVTIDQSCLDAVSLACTASGGGLTQYRAVRLLANNNSSAYVAINGEL